MTENRVQLTEYRKRGVKAYLTGHVPPGKKFYYASCFRRYTLWSHAFRDVILGHLYGHNNMDHFFFLDAKQALEEEEEALLLKSLLRDEIARNPETLSDSELEAEAANLVTQISRLVIRLKCIKSIQSARSEDNLDQDQLPNP